MEHLSNKQKVVIMIAIMSGMFFASVNQTIVGNALPKIVAELGGMDYYSWVFTIFMLTSSITTILVGKLSDIYGRKPFMLIGIFIFIIGALLSGFSTDIFQLITYRGIQGFGAGMIMSTAFTAVGDLFSPRERGKWTGIMSGVFGLSSVFGPTLGGFIVDHYDWHWVFWVFLPLGIVAFGLIWWLFPSTQKKEGETVDYLGSIFLTTTLVPLLLAFTWAGTKYDWESPQIISLFGATIVSLIIFMIVEQKVKSPILPLHLFKNGVFAISNIIGFAIGIAMFGSVMFIPYFIQGVLGFTATHSSYITMTMTLSLVLASSIGGMLITKTGKYKLQAILGLMLTTVGMYLFTTMDSNTSQYAIVLFLCTVGFGLGIGMTVFTLTIQNSVEQSYLGVATASAQLFRSIGGTVGVALMGTVLNQRMTDKMGELAGESQGLSNIPPEMAQSFEALKNPQILLDHEKLEEIKGMLPPQMQEIFTNLLHVLQDAMTYALSGVFFIGMVIMVIAVILTFFLKEVPLRGAAPKEPKKAEAVRTNLKPEVE